MASDLALLEKDLAPLAPQFEQVLEGVMSPARLIRTVIVAAEKTPKILDCTRQSIFNAAMSAAIIGVEPDGVTGQSFILPFNKRAQLVIGYKGYNTIGARSNLTITGGIVREGDDVWDFMDGTTPYIKHKAKMGNQGRIIASWACATALDRPPIISVLDIDALFAIKTKSPGAKMSDSPWNDPAIGLPAMYSKSSKRRLARSTPLVLHNTRFHLAARMDEAFEEQGRASWITPDRQVHVGSAVESPLPDRGDPADTPTKAALVDEPPDPIFDALKLEAAKGMKKLEKKWMEYEKTDRVRLKGRLERELKPIAEKADDTALREGTGSPAAAVTGEIQTASSDPKDDAAYRAHAEKWIANLDKVDATAKWQSDRELELRGLCNVTQETRTHLLKLIGERP